MIGNLGIILVVGAIAVTVAMGLLKKLEIDVEGKFEGGNYETEFEFEWELEKEKRHRRHKENRDNRKKDSRDTLAPLEIPREQPAVPSSYYYPFYPAVGVPPYYPSHYW